MRTLQRFPPVRKIWLFHDYYILIGVDPSLPYPPTTVIEKIGISSVAVRPYNGLECIVRLVLSSSWHGKREREADNVG